jgi:hypothetical protein
MRRGEEGKRKEEEKEGGPEPPGCHGRSLHPPPGRYHLQERHTREKARPVPLGGGSTRGTAQC